MPKPSEVTFSPIDHAILNSYKPVLEGLARYLGEGYEFVLHSLEDFNHSVVKIINGHHTGRKEGAPVTDLALEMLERIQSDEQLNDISYFTKNKRGEPLKSATIAIKGAEGKIIGLMCINLYLNTPLSTFVEILHSEVSLKETFESVRQSEDPDGIVRKATREALQAVQEDTGILPSLKNREAVALLEHQGIFKIKDSVLLVADEMGISKNTVYLHLRNVKKEMEE